VNVGILFTVRISSSRLPGKALLEVRGIPMIVYLIKRFKAMCSEKLIICTTDLPEDSCFDIIAEQLEIEIFHGNANNILHRHLKCAEQFFLDYIINVDCDDIFSSPELVERITSKLPMYNVVYSDGYPFGTNLFAYSTEVMGFLPVHEKQVDTGWGALIKNNPSFTQYVIEANSNERNEIRLSMDYMQDFLLFKCIIEALDMDTRVVSQNEIIEYVKNNQVLLSGFNNKMSEGQKLYLKAKQIIPGGTQLLSKRPEMFLPDYWPSYYSRAKGCKVWDLDGYVYTDCSYMGIGANVLGYAFEPVDEAAKQAIENGGMCTLNAPEEVTLAELILKIHPWADMVRYAKAGGEAMAMAVRIARAYAKKDIVLVCGYHGWHDWYLAANLVRGDPLADVHLKGLDPSGVPQRLAGSNLIFHYNDLPGFMKLIDENEGRIAAVVMEPIRNEYPRDGFLDEVRQVTSKKKIVLIFDEITAGFRICCGGSHLMLNVEPDIAVFAKGITNGYPLSVLIGKADVMSAAQDTFISSTFWTERVAFAAAIASVNYFKEYEVHKHLMELGQYVQLKWKELAEACNLDILVGGIFPLSHFSLQYKDALAHKTFFTQQMLSEGYLASTAFYLSLAHSKEIVDGYLTACGKVFQSISDIRNTGGSIINYLKGPVCHEGFQRLN